MRKEELRRYEHEWRIRKREESKCERCGRQFRGDSDLCADCDQFYRKAQKRLSLLANHEVRYIDSRDQSKFFNLINDA